MVRGLIAGVGTGAVVSALVLGALSVLAPLPVVQTATSAVPPLVSAPTIETVPLVAPPAEITPPAAAAPPGLAAPLPDAVSVPAASEFARGAGDRTPAAPSGEEAPAATAAAPEAPAAPAGTMPLASAAPAPAARPDVPSSPAMPDVPAGIGEAPLSPAAEAPVPVPPPGAARAPGLAPSGGEIVLMPNGAPAPASAPRVFAPGQGAPGTVVNRLPSIGSEPPPLIEPAPGEAVAPSAVPEAKSAAFAARPGQPVLPIILVDVGVAAGGLDRQAIKALGLPLTVAIDPTRVDAAIAAAEFRAAGMEVAILAAPLPDGATAQDAEVALEAWRRAVPGAVAVVEPPTPVFQNNRLLSQTIIKALEREGLGLVTQQGTGMNAAQQIARADGLPEVSIWRVLDGGRDSEAEIGRVLGRAEFETERAGGAVVMLHAWPASLMGLRGWAEAGTKTAPAPVSAVLGRD